MKKLLLSLIVMLSCGVTWAQSLTKDLADYLENYNHEMPFQEHAYWYIVDDLDGDGQQETALANYDKTRVVAYKNGQRMAQQPKIDRDWDVLLYYFFPENTNLKNDVTLKYRPLFIDDPKISKNRFTADNEIWYSSGVEYKDIKNYNRLFFKHHVGEAKFVKEKATGKNNKFTYALTNAALTKKMFRGYTDYIAVPVAVPAAWLNDHKLLKYDRWLNGEKEVPVARDIVKIISDKFGGKRIIASKWLATCPDYELNVYIVLFEPVNHKGLMAVVCESEGEVTSSANFWYGLDETNKFTDSGEEYNKELFFHAPRISAMVDTPAGMELYVSYPSLEGIHYSIWRELYDTWVQIQDDYRYIMAY